MPAARIGLCSVGFSRLEHLDFDGHDASLAESETFGGADRHIDDAAFDVGAAVIDGDDLRFAVGLIRHAYLGSHRKRLVCGGRFQIAKFLTAGGLGAEVGGDRVP